MAYRTNDDDGASWGRPGGAHGFLGGEERRYAAMTAGTEALACWASQAIGHCDEMGVIYADGLVGLLVGGSRASRIVAIVERDLRQAGRSDLAKEVATRYALAISAADEVPGGLGRPRRDTPPLVAPHPHGFWGWAL